MLPSLRSGKTTFALAACGVFVAGAWFLASPGASARAGEASPPNHELSVTVEKKADGGIVRVEIKARGVFVFKPPHKDAELVTPMFLKFKTPGTASFAKAELGWDDVKIDGNKHVSAAATYTKGVAGDEVEVQYRFGICEEERCILVRDTRKVKLP